VYINHGPQLILVSAEIFTAYSLESVARDRIADLFRDRDPQSGDALLTTRMNQNEVPAKQAFSVLRQLQVFGTFPYSVLFGVAVSQQYRSCPSSEKARAGRIRIAVPF
jgi:hypothetical protein